MKISKNQRILVKLGFPLGIFLQFGESGKFSSAKISLGGSFLSLGAKIILGEMYCTHHSNATVRLFIYLFNYLIDPNATVD